MKTIAALPAALAFGSAVFAVALPSAASAPSVVQPQWITRPSGAVIERYYPVKAKLAARSGKAAMRCSVTAAGGVENCRILTETPRAYGFGESLLSMARFFKMKPQDVEGRSLQGTDVTIQLSFYVE